MSRRATGWALLVLALLGAAVVAALGLRAGRVDTWLAVLAGLAVTGAAVTVLLDRRVLARRGADGAPRGRGSVDAAPRPGPPGARPAG